MSSTAEPVPLNRQTKTSSRRRRTTLDPSILAVVRSAGEGSWDSIVAETGGGTVRIRERRRLAAEALEAWLDAERAGVRLAIVPSAATICRMFRLPGVAPEQVRQALRLQAETHLLGGVPRHRTAVAPLPLGMLGPDPVGLLLAWPEQSHAAMPPGHGWRAVPEVLALLETQPSGGSSVEPGFIADERDGSIGVLLSGPNGPLLRATCEADEGGDSWLATVRRALVETAMAAGHEATDAAAIADRLLAGVSARDGLVCSGPLAAGASSQDRIDALLLAAANAATGPLREFTEILDRPEVETRPGFAGLVESSLAKLSEPAFAIRFAIAAILVAMALPVAAAGLRVAILRAKLPDPAAFETSMQESERQLAVYRELEAQAWPFMKVLGDLSNCMPEAIEVESIVMGHGEPITIRGIAKPENDQTGADAILEMERRMRACGIFDKITKRWDPPDGRGVYEFSLSADVARPTRPARFSEAEDFAVTSLAERRYGPAAKPATYRASDDSTRAAAPDAPDAPSTTEREPAATSRRASAGASRAATPPPADQDATSPEPRDSVANAAEEPSAAGSGLPDRGIGRRRPNDDGATGGGREVAVPDPSTTVAAVDFSDAEIEAMSKAEAQTALGKVARARQSPGLDDAAKERLRTLFDKLLRRVREAP